MSLPLPLTIAIERGVEAVLRLDPDTRARLDALDGKLISINLTAPRLGFCASVVNGHVFIIGEGNPQADLCVSGSWQALRSLTRENDALYRGDVVMQGDVGLAHHLRECLAGLDPDWEEWLSPVLGDSLVHRLARSGKLLGRWFDRSSSALTRNSSEYLQEEIELVAPNSEINEFCAEVDDVRAAVDRLEARIRLIERARSAVEGEHSC